jgi:N-acetylglucosamine kinase-like BadF-type ATPase
MQTFEEIKNLVAAAEADVVKFAEKGNKAAGTRVRQAMQELKKLSQQVRIEVQESKNQG